MTNSNLSEIINAFSLEEREAFPLFLKSPYFVQEGNADDLLRLFLYFLNADPHPRKGIPDKPDIHAFVFPEKTFSISRLEKAMAKLALLVEQFLVTRYYHRADNQKQRALDFVSVLREKRLASIYEKKLQKLHKEAEESVLESTENYKLRYQIAREEHEWRSLFNKLNGDVAIPETVRQLDLFYFSERIELLNRLLLQQKVVALEKKNALISGFETPPYYDQYELQSPLIFIRRQIQHLLLQNEPGKQAFESLLRLIKEHERDFPEESIRELFTYLRNFCTLIVNTSMKDEEKSGMYEVLHQIQQDNLTRGYFYHNGQIPPYGLINIIKVALKVKDIQWAKQFLISHRYKIVTDDKIEEHFKFCLALCHFTEKKYEESLQNISYPSNSPFLFLETRRLELKNYYELRLDILLYKIDSYRKFLERTAPKIISMVEREMNINFVNLLLQLVQSKPTDKLRSTRLLKRIKEKKAVAERMWLIEKAQELA